VPSRTPLRGSTIYRVERPSTALTWTAIRSPAALTETTCAPEGSAMFRVKAPVGAAGAEALDMRRAISAAITTKPATISRPITITSTFSQSGA